MNAITQSEQSAFEHAVALFKAMPIPQSEAATDAFGALIDAGYIRIEHFAALCYRMHNRMVDHHQDVMTWVQPEHELETVGDALIKAIECAEVDEQDNYEPEAA